MKFYLQVIILLAVVGIILGVYYNLPTETITMIDILPTKLPSIQIPMASENGGFTGGILGG